MIEFRPATQEDLAFVRQSPYEGAIKNYPFMYVPDDNCYTVLVDNAIVAVYGLQVKWEGVGLLWLMLVSDFQRHGVHKTIRTVGQKMNELIKKNNLWRAEANVRVDFPKAIKMIEYFGFEREGTMKKYAPDKCDMYLYSKIME